jgi:hypothetical protein
MSITILLKIQTYLLILLSSLVLICPAREAPLPIFDFSQEEVTKDWIDTNDISHRLTSQDGLEVTLSGSDPYLIGPARNFPAGQNLWARLRLMSERRGSCQIFYYRSIPTEAQSARFDVTPGLWIEGRIALPPLGESYRIRIDPPGARGKVILDSLSFEIRSALPDFDFSTYPDSAEWINPHDLQRVITSSEGLKLEITGPDPYIFGPPRDYPPDQLLWARLLIKSEQGGNAQIFYFKTGATEENSVRFFVSAGEWVEARVPLPALDSGWRLRIDPPGIKGACILKRLTFEARNLLQPPSWNPPSRTPISAAAAVISSGNLQLRHSNRSLGAFDIRVADKNVARGHDQALLGYTMAQNTFWISLTNAVTLERQGDILKVSAQTRDPHGAQWLVQQEFKPSDTPGGIDIESQLVVDQERELVFGPMILLMAGLDSFGANKTQALLAGVEYLANEPSSSEADVIGPGALRKAPDNLKLTFPLMALSAEQRYLGLIWQPQEQFAALFDSPDRIFHSTSHVMGIISPGSHPNMRPDGALLPYAGQRLNADQALVLRATLIGGHGSTIIPALKQYVQRRGLPQVPKTDYTADGFLSLAAHGWLDSEIRDGARFRHAVGPQFGSHAAVDAVFYADWLATQVSNLQLGERLRALAAEALKQLTPQSYYSAHVGHVRFPLGPLVYGSVLENAATVTTHGHSRLNAFSQDGSIIYRAPAGGIDYAKTHWSREANGLTATHVTMVLRDAIFSGDQELIDSGLELLRAMGKFANTVPRGAQTWEVPLHTPDILASAYLTYAYILGWELTHETQFLEQAKYWAWTGVPFVYLTPPTTRPVGVYSTTPVLGATQFVAPLWIGLPVQWCGLVYADAIRRLGRYDTQGPWLQLANGIAAAGIQHTHTQAEPEYQGLLPDSFDLRAQFRNPVPINPGTLLPGAIALYGKQPLYDYQTLIHHNLIIHSPGPITKIHETADTISVKVDGWPSKRWWVYINGFNRIPRVWLNDRVTALRNPHRFDRASGRLILALEESTRIEIRLPALDAMSIQHGAQADHVILGWPTSARDYVLERSQRLDVWDRHFDIMGPYAQDQEGFTYLINSLKPLEFFRLRRKERF